MVGAAVGVLPPASSTPDLAHAVAVLQGTVALSPSHAGPTSEALHVASGSTPVPEGPHWWSTRPMPATPASASVASSRSRPRVGARGGGASAVPAIVVKSEASSCGGATLLSLATWRLMGLFETAVDDAATQAWMAPFLPCSIPEV